jgi:hypothetical protein
MRLYRYFVSQSSEFCLHNPLCCFSTSNDKGKRIFRYRFSPETFVYTLVDGVWGIKSNFFWTSARERGEYILCFTLRPIWHNEKKLPVPNNRYLGRPRRRDLSAGDSSGGKMIFLTLCVSYKVRRRLTSRKSQVTALILRHIRKDMHRCPPLGKGKVVFVI